MDIGRVGHALGGGVCWSLEFVVIETLGTARQSVQQMQPSVTGVGWRQGRAVQSYYKVLVVLQTIV